jgi:cytochrome c
MFDTMTLTKVTGSVCGALLIYLFGAWAADGLYKVSHEAHGDEVAQAYTIEVAVAEETSDAVVEEGPTFDIVMASADADAGEKVFGKCKACHKLDGTDGTGPHLNGVVSRAKASVAGFNYSAANLAMAGDDWTPENIYAFLENPKGYMPGTKMSFAGLSKSQDRANVIAYLETTN